MSKKPKNNPTPVRFNIEEDDWLKQVETMTSLPKGDIVRRAVRYLARETSKGGLAKLMVIPELKPEESSPPKDSTA